MSPLHWLNNAAEQHPQESIAKITEKQLERTFRANIFSMFFMTKAVMRHFKNGGNIINTTSVTAYQGSPHLLDYSSTKGAIVAFTRSLCQALADQGNSGKCGRTGTNLDAADSLDLSDQDVDSAEFSAGSAHRIFAKLFATNIAGQ
jgi:NAD(P)-dependent dehydrogenase (short-subunit alcohol dehydrogenase family)